MSTTITAVFINLLATLLPLFNINLGSDDLTKAAQVIITIATGLWIWYQRVQRGDVKFSGVRK